jgi:hypothetical protein
MPGISILVPNPVVAVIHRLSSRPLAHYFNTCVRRFSSVMPL